jgi:4-amino-4-deoxy-L-arabinose transferase-like glycosyltransferase
MPPQSEIRNPKSAIWPTTAVLLLSATLSLIGLVGHSPPGVAHDEVAHWLISRQILAGQHAIYFTEAYGHEAGFHYWQTLFVALIGDNILALRLASAYAGLLATAVTYPLARRLFGRKVALLVVGLTAVLFWPIFYNRMALRAISLPLLSGLSAYWWWTAWGRTGDEENGRTGERERGRTGDKETVSPSPRLLVFPSPLLPFLLAGLFAGLSLHTYMAARAVPIFYGLFIGYLALFHWAELRARWRGVALFGLTFALVAAPLAWYLWSNPGAEFRVAEVSGPLTALRAGDFGPVLQNGLKIAAAFAWDSAALWREGIPGRPVFGPLLAICFYGGVLLSLWRWRDKRYGFLLLWGATAVLPSLVTINAPSPIRMINLLPILALFPALFIHSFPALSTVFPRLSTETRRLRPIFVASLCLLYAGWTAWSIFRVWPVGGDIPFVWQTALRDVGAALDSEPAITAAAIAGWSPDTMDPPTMALYLRRDDVALSHFGTLPGEDIIYTLLIPNAAADGARHIFRPAILPLAEAWEERLRAWETAVLPHPTFTHYILPGDVDPKGFGNPSGLAPANTFGDQLHFLGHDLTPCSPAPPPPSPPACLLTTWQVVAPIRQPLRLFVHVLGEDGEMLGEDYRWDTADPQNLWQAHWQVGDVIMQLHPLDLEGAAALRLGLFDPYSCEPGPCENVVTAVGEPFILLPLEEHKP